MLPTSLVMTAFLSLSSAFTNLGDEVINRMLICEIVKRTRLVALNPKMPQWYIKNLIKDLESYSDRIKITDSHCNFFLRLALAGLKRERSYLFTSPGGASRGNSSPVRDSFLAALQFLPSLRWGMVGNTFESLNTSRVLALRIAQSRGRAISVRECASRQLLLRHRIIVDVVPDLAFLLPFQDLRPKSILLISMRTSPSSSQAVLQSLIPAVSIARTLHLNPVVTWQNNNDEEYCRWIASSLGLQLKPLPTYELGRLEEACLLYDQAAAVISNRLHVLLIAASRGAKPVPILYPGEIKVRGVFSHSGLQHNTIEVGTSSTIDIQKAVASEWHTSECRQVFHENARKLTLYFNRVLGSCISE